MRKAFTVVELLAAVSILVIIVGLAVPILGAGKATSDQVTCISSLRQLGLATELYLQDNEQVMFAYRVQKTGGILWYFGFETGNSQAPEGSRDLDRTQAALYPYIKTVGKIEVCPAFPYKSALWKPKFEGASYGYGFNIALSSTQIPRLENRASVILFGDCAQVNTFQKPATPTHPMLEEFYLIDEANKSVHFRHGDKANMLFLDGHVNQFPLYPGTEDMRLKSVKVGRITPTGSSKWLR